MQNSVGYPYTYGDTLSAERARLNLFDSLNQSSQIVVTGVIIGAFSTSASAIEPAVKVVSTTNISKESLALTAAICAGAGSVCTKATAKTVSQNPKMAAAFGCVALLSWCAAKASPL